MTRLDMVSLMMIMMMMMMMLGQVLLMDLQP
jgi:hypothetical protein